jgi:hypothetical protein
VTWRRLDLGMASEKAIAMSPDHAPIIRGMLGEPTVRATLTAWIARTRPSKVLGMLQFAAAFSSDWTAGWDAFALPAVLKRVDGRFEWETETVYSLAEADRKLKQLMGISPGKVVPLIPD